MEPKEWEYSIVSNRGLRGFWVVLGVIFLMQAYTSLDRSDTTLGTVQVVLGVASLLGAAFLVPRINRSRVSVDETGVRLPRGAFRSRRVTWEELERVHLHRMGIDLERKEGKTESLHFSEMSYNTIQTLRPELHAHLKQMAEAKGIDVMEHDGA